MPSKHRPSTLPSSIGYQVFSMLNQPFFAQRMMVQTYADTIAGSITSQDIVPTELKKCGNMVIFRRKPEGEIFDLIKNQPLEVSQIMTSTITMVVKRAKYWNVKVDEIDISQTCDIKRWIQWFLDDCAEKLRQKIDAEILDYIPRKAHPFNKGLRAGKLSGSYNLGAMGAPVQLTADTLIEHLTNLSAVLTEQMVPRKGRFIVLPPVAETLFYRNQLLNNAAASGLSRAVVLSENVPEIMGFKVFFSPNMPMMFDPIAGKNTFMVVAGLKEATGFVTQLVKQQHIDQVSTAFEEYWRGMQIYDFEVIEPEKLAVLYATVSI